MGKYHLFVNSLREMIVKVYNEKERKKERKKEGQIKIGRLK